MRFVSAPPLVERPSGLGKYHGLSAGDVLQENYGVGQSSFGSHDQPLQVDGLASLRITYLGVLADGYSQSRWNCAGPFHSSGNSSRVVYGDNLVSGLRLHTNSCRE